MQEMAQLAAWIDGVENATDDELSEAAPDIQRLLSDSPGGLMAIAAQALRIADERISRGSENDPDMALGEALRREIALRAEELDETMDVG